MEQLIGQEQPRGNLILVTGGARSGKSSFAEKIAAASGKKVIYIATAVAGDSEMRRRIAAHRRRRPVSFRTIEASRSPHRVIVREDSPEVFFLLDCFTVLLSNRLLEGSGGENGAGRAAFRWRARRALAYALYLSRVLRECRAGAILVTNEVGSGVVPESFLGRLFRDLAGRANQAAAAAADEVWWTVCGLPQRIK